MVTKNHADRRTDSVNVLYSETFILLYSFSCLLSPFPKKKNYNDEDEYRKPLLGFNLEWV